MPEPKDVVKEFKKEAEYSVEYGPLWDDSMVRKLKDALRQLDSANVDIARLGYRAIENTEGAQEIKDRMNKVTSEISDIVQKMTGEVL